MYSMSTQLSTQSKGLEEENQRLRELVRQLQGELVQRNALISSLEAQIKSLVKSENCPVNENFDGDKEMDAANKKKFIIASSNTDPRTVKTTDGRNATKPTRLSLPPKPPFSSTISRRQEVGDQESLPPSKPKKHDHRAMSLQPPSRTEVEMSSPLPDPQIQLQNLQPKSPGTVCSLGSISLSQLRIEDSKNGKTDGEDLEGSRRIINKSQGPIRMLPRELSIFNSDDDDITKYSIEDNMPTYELFKSEMRDAYNARGIYTGTVCRKEQLPDGKGLMEYHHLGRSYEGDWVKGHWHGIGRIQSPYGDVYEGEVVNDLRHGDGRLHYSDGRVFEGRFQQDDPVYGTVNFPDGAKYVGELHNGARHGYGVYYFTDDSKYEGYSVMNIFEGEGKMTWNDGGWYEGEWLQGEIHGVGKEVRADGSIRHEGQWSKGVPIRQ